jgi:hypothetical protein
MRAVKAPYKVTYAIKAEVVVYAPADPEYDACLIEEQARAELDYYLGLAKACHIEFTQVDCDEVTAA